MKKLLTILFLLFSIYSQGGIWSYCESSPMISSSTTIPTIKGVYVSKPTSGYGADTIFSFTINNKNTNGQSGFNAIRYQDTMTMKINSSGYSQWSDEDETVFLKNIHDSSEIADESWTFNLIEIDTLTLNHGDFETITVNTFDTLSFYRLNEDTIHTYNFFNDTLSYYHDSTEIANEAWTFTKNINTDSISFSGIWSVKGYDYTCYSSTSLVPSFSRFRVQGAGENVTITEIPTISNGKDGQIIYIIGTSSNTVTFQDNDNLPGSNIELNNSNDITLGEGDILVLIFDSILGKWYYVSYTNN